jgi:hypothetical protein
VLVLLTAIPHVHMITFFHPHSWSRFMTRITHGKCQRGHREVESILIVSYLLLNSSVCHDFQSVSQAGYAPEPSDTFLFRQLSMVSLPAEVLSVLPASRLRSCNCFCACAVAFCLEFLSNLPRRSRLVSFTWRIHLHLAILSNLA